ncbi:MAG: 50S ribosomal protein L15 [Waddliaceae bacterium]|nr:50S ribosomal protein L15 [Waddliaceae bacterium]
MSQSLSTLTNERQRQGRKRVGRGIGSGMGKTCCRGQKGAGSRSGYKRRLGKEGGQVPLFRKMPTRGFSNARFRKELNTINLSQIEEVFEDGSEVSLDSLRDKGLVNGRSYGLKVLGDGELTKKVKIRCKAISASARAKCEQLGVEVEICS